MTEEWFDITDFPMYEISNRWRVRRKDSKKIIKTSVNDNGCDYVVLRKDGKSCSRSLNKLVRTSLEV